MKLNGNFQNLQQSYLFVTIAKKVAAYTQEHPDNKIIKMGIGDVTMPLAPAVIEAMHQATEEQAHKETFHGYSPDSDGYPFLREAIANYYKNFGVDMDPSEVFVGDGTTPCWCPTRCTLCMWIPTSSPAGTSPTWTPTSKTAFCPCPTRA